MRRIVCALAAVAALLLTAPPAAAKSFRIAAVQIEADLRPDSSMHVVEHITYDFDGSFSEGLRPIPRGPYQVAEMSVTENGVPLPISGDPYNLSFRFSASNERRTFDIAYTVLGAASVGPDVAELYWKWVGDQHPGVDVVRVALNVPGEGGVRAWGHGPLDGAVEIRGNQVLFSVDGLDGGTFVEGRVAIPAAVFSVTPSGPPRLESIVAAETALANRANAERDRREQLRRVLKYLYPIVPVAGWLVFLFLWIRWGREHRHVEVDIGEYIREPLDDPPALVDPLRRFGTVVPLAISATLVDLAQRGYLTIEEEGDERTVDWRFRSTGPGEGAPSAYEAMLLSQLFASGDETTNSAFLKWAKLDSTEASRWWALFRHAVEVAFRERAYTEGGKGPVFGVNVLTGCAVILASLGALSGGSVVGLAGLVSGGGQLALTPLLRRRSPAGHRRLMEWRAFERFLRDFSQLDDAPVGHLVLWERYMVYAVALGIADEVAEGLAAKIPAATVTSDQPFMPWYRASHVATFGHFGSLGRLGTDFGPSLVAAAAPPTASSSGAGFGGGFSGGGFGGGGGGGGGGGIGAR